MASSICNKRQSIPTCCGKHPTKATKQWPIYGTQAGFSDDQTKLKLHLDQVGLLAFDLEDLKDCLSIFFILQKY